MKNRDSSGLPLRQRQSGGTAGGSPFGSTRRESRIGQAGLESPAVRGFGAAPGGRVFERTPEPVWPAPVQSGPVRPHLHLSYQAATSRDHAGEVLEPDGLPSQPSRSNPLQDRAGRDAAIIDAEIIEEASWRRVD